MSRLSQRISSVWTAVKCPKCGMLVAPTSQPAGDGKPAGDAQGKRWSFLWVEPRGDFCPECEFPLSKYFGRLKWIRTAMIGVAVVLAALVLQLLGIVLILGPRYNTVMKSALLVGAAATVIGVAGVVIGGRHAAPR